MGRYRYQALGPLQAGEGSRAFLGLAISEDGRARPVVIVWLPDGARDDAELIAKIRRETEHAARLDHPNIVTVMGYADLDEGGARVVEFADGESLRKIIDTAHKLPPRIAARIIIDACTGTHYAHVAGNDDGSPLVHGDLRPETLLISFGGVTKVTGYGALAFAPRELGGQRVKGRRIHSAPEQIIGGREAISIPTDVYLLGLTLYEALTGIVPWFDQADFFDHAVLTLPLPPAPPGDIPAQLEGVILKACSKKASDRYPTPLALREAIETAMADEVASTDELAHYLETLFPQSHALRADRRRTIDAGIADLVRRQWADKEAPAAAPPSPVPPPAAPVTTAAPPPAAPAPAPPPQRAPETPKRAPTAATPAAARAAPRPSETLDEDDAPQRSNPLPWVLVLAGFVAVIAGWWAWDKAHQPVRGSQPERVTTSTPAVTVPTPPMVIDAGVAAVAQAADEEDAGVAALPDAAVAVAPEMPVEPLPPEPVKPAAPVDVQVSITSTPPADLFLGTQSLGRTPWTGRLPPGKKTLRFENKALMLNAWRSVTPTDEPVSESYTFEKGFVIINAPEGALVTIDGTRIGSAPIRGEVPVYEGSHRIYVNIGKAKWSEAFTLYGGQRVSFNVEMQ